MSESISLEALGWDAQWEERFGAFASKGCEPGRVAVEDKHRYVVVTRSGELSGQLAGKVLHHARSQAALPKVGDWVAAVPLPKEGKAVIHHVLPRKTKISRKVPGRETDEQVLVTNIDLAMVVQGMDRGINAALLQRYLVMVLESGSKALAILNKSDLCDNLSEITRQARQAAGDVPVLTASAKDGRGISELRALIVPGTTVVFLGASGVGKSSLINRLYGEEIQATAEVRENDAKGRHTTSWRELILLPGGGVVIDTPGMREFQMWLAGEGLQDAFPDIDALSVRCRFSNCSHTVEKGCAVLEALSQGDLSAERYQSYLKLSRELYYLETARHQKTVRRRKPKPEEF